VVAQEPLAADIGLAVLKNGGKEHTLPQTDLSRLIRDASSP